MRVYNFGVVGITSRHFTSGVTHSRGDQMDTNFTRGAPYKIWECKKRPKFSAIFSNFRLWSQIGLSQEWINISQIRKLLDQLHFMPYFAKKFGELWSTNNKVNIYAHVDPPNWTFSEDYTSAPRGRWPVTFLHALDTGQGLLANTTNRVGGLRRNFKDEHLKLGLKFHTCAPITLGVVGITLRNFTRGCGS